MGWVCVCGGREVLKAELKKVMLDLRGSRFTVCMQKKPAFQKPCGNSRSRSWLWYVVRFGLGIKQWVLRPVWKDRVSASIMPSSKGKFPIRFVFLPTLVLRSSLSSSQFQRPRERLSKRSREASVREERGGGEGHPGKSFRRKAKTKEHKDRTGWAFCPCTLSTARKMECLLLFVFFSFPYPNFKPTLPCH